MYIPKWNFQNVFIATVLTSLVVMLIYFCYYSYKSIVAALRPSDITEPRDLNYFPVYFVKYKYTSTPYRKVFKMKVVIMYDIFYASHQFTISRFCERFKVSFHIHQE
jgi:hypothetical protein